MHRAWLAAAGAALVGLLVGCSASYVSERRFVWTSDGVERTLETDPQLRFRYGSIAESPPAAVVRLTETRHGETTRAELRQTDGKLELRIASQEGFRPATPRDHVWLEQFLRAVEPDGGVRSVTGGADRAAALQHSSTPKSTGRVVSEEVADAVAAAQVRLALLESLGQDALPIEVDVAGGQATLRGTVGDARAKGAAEQAARGVKGVRGVLNKLTVRAASRPLAARSRPVLDEAKQDLSAAGLVAKVKLYLLAEIGLTAFKIDVEARDGVVTLSGTVPRPEQHQLAVDAVSTIKEIRQLNDRIRVE